MIHSVTDDYKKFKYKAFLVELTAGNLHSGISLDIPFLVDAINEDDVKKVVENFRNKLYVKEYLTGINTEKDIHTKKEIGLLTEDFKDKLKKFDVLVGYENFKEKVEKVREKVGKSQYLMVVDILSGTSEIKKVVSLPIDTKPNYPGIQIAIKDLYEDKTDEVKE